MAIATSTALGIAAIAVAAAGTAVSVSASSSSASKARKQASAQADQTRQSQEKIQEEAKRRAGEQESADMALRKRNEARGRQASLATGAGGRRDTILTGPIGDTGEVAGAQKTLLGA